MWNKILMNDWYFAAFCIVSYTIATGLVLWGAYRWDQRDRKKGRIF